MFQDPNLPCGVTNAMCEPNDPNCGRCGHLYSDHYYEDGQEEIINYVPLNVKSDHEHMNIEYDSRGEVVHACDSTSGGKRQEEILRNQCDCTGFSDDEYEPDWDSMNEGLD